MADLKPCPFCGAAVRIEEEWADALSVFYSFNCDHCGMYCFQNELVPKDVAIEAWNNRVPQTTVNQFGENCTHIANCGTLNLNL